MDFDGDVSIVNEKYDRIQRMRKAQEYIDLCEKKRIHCQATIDSWCVRISLIALCFVMCLCIFRP